MGSSLQLNIPSPFLEMSTYFSFLTLDLCAARQQIIGSVKRYPRTISSITGTSWYDISYKRVLRATQQIPQMGYIYLTEAMQSFKGTRGQW